MIEDFIWSDRFATGIESVDIQHKQLLELINEIGRQLSSAQEIDEPALQALCKQLADYARFHFVEEERVMIESGVDPRHITHHKELHRGFIEQVVAMWQGRAHMTHPAETLHGFLSAWLVVHIIGEDQSMARQRQAILGGISASAAFDDDTRHRDDTTSAMLNALQNLYHVLSQQNSDLAKVNIRLEATVAERTAELTSTYAKLAVEHQELTASMNKVEQAQNALLQSEKMAAVGQLAAGVAHEINNPIGFVNSNLGTLNRYVADLLRLADTVADSPLAKEIDLPFLHEDVGVLLSESREGLDRVRKIVANLKDFAHVDEAEWQQTDLVAGLESTVTVASHELRYKAEIVRKLSPLPLVNCIPAQLNQVFLNILINAAQAIPEHGVITLSSGVGMQEGKDHVWIEIADTGKGMSADVKRRIFEPFFTTKPVGQGTGLGMSLAYDIITKHNGKCEVDSAPGEGTRIRLWLPVAGPADAGSAAGTGAA